MLHTLGAQLSDVRMSRICWAIHLCRWRGILRNKHSHGIDGPFIDEFPIKTSIHKGFSMAMLRSASGSELRCQHEVSVCCMQAELDLQCYGGQTSSPEGHLRQGTTSQPVSYLQPTKIRGMAQENPKNILSITNYPSLSITIIHHYYPSLLSITIIHHYYPSLLSITIIHHYYPSLLSVTIIHHYYPSLLSITTIHHYYPSRLSITIIHHYYPSLSIIY